MKDCSLLFPLVLAKIPFSISLINGESISRLYEEETMGTMGKALYNVGFWIRETGQALDRLGCRLQGKNHFREQRTSLHRLVFLIYIRILV